MCFHSTGMVQKNKATTALRPCLDPHQPYKENGDPNIPFVTALTVFLNRNPMKSQQTKNDMPIPPP